MIPGFSICNSECVLIIVQIIHHLTDSLVLRLSLTTHVDVCQKDVTVLDLLLQIILRYRSTVHLLDGVAFPRDLSDEYKAARGDESLIAELDMYSSHSYFLRICIYSLQIHYTVFGSVVRQK